MRVYRGEQTEYTSNTGHVQQTEMLYKSAQHLLPFLLAASCYVSQSERDEGVSCTIQRKNTQNEQERAAIWILLEAFVWQRGESLLVNSITRPPPGIAV